MARGRMWRFAVGVAAGALGATVLAGPAQAAPEGVVRAAGGATAVAGSYIVVLKDGADVSSVRATADRLVAAHRGAVGAVYSAAINGFEATLSERAARRLAAHPAVAYVEQNHQVSIAGTQSPVPSWGLDRIDQEKLPLDNSYTYPNTAPKVYAYIIDTGIQFSHPEFGGRAVSGFDAIDGGSADDCHGHGTHVAGTVGSKSYGVAKEVRLVAVRVLNCAGSGTYAQVIAGIDYVTARATRSPSVANMSLGGGFSSAVNDAVTRSIASGVTYSVAAGNSYGANACNYSPASTPAAITVGATDINDRVASYSNVGSCLDLFAPGSAITSTWINNGVNTISGTSMAAPHVAGVAAMLLYAHPTLTPADVAAKIVGNATSGVLTGVPPGTPNLLLHVI